jgi:hypothetical protein
MIDTANRRPEVGINLFDHDQLPEPRSFANRYSLGMILTITGALGGPCSALGRLLRFAPLGSSTQNRQTSQHQGVGFWFRDGSNIAIVKYPCRLFTVLIPVALIAVVKAGIHALVTSFASGVLVQ